VRAGWLGWSCAQSPRRGRTQTNPPTDPTPPPQAKKGGRSQVFYTLPEYEAWRESLGAAGTAGWDIKYYKGGAGVGRWWLCLGGGWDCRAAVACAALRPGCPGLC
jgi:hypothetical protein